MIERVIENWLTSVSERDFQIPFCQLLALKGQRVVHVSPHGPFEQGKDIITVDADGQAHAYQLKVGDISLQRWRDEVRAEVDELLDLPIAHPSIDKRQPHRSYLITTGNFGDPVRRAIDDANEDRFRKGKLVLETKTRGQLLSDFIEAHEDLLPKEVTDLRSFFELYTRPGYCNMPKEKLVTLLMSVQPFGAKGQAPSTRKIERASASLLLLASYLLMTYDREKNHWAAAEGWAVTTASLLALAERHGVSPGLSITIDLAKRALCSSVEALKEEALARTSFFEPGLVDGPFYRYRLPVLFGYMAAYQLAKKSRGETDWHDPRVNEFLTDLSGDLRLAGESTIAFLLPMYWYLQETGDGTGAAGLYRVVLTGLADIASKPDGGLANPYYDLDTLLRAELGLLDEPVDENFALQSYLLRAFLTLGARRDHRDVVADNWRSITKVHCSEFYPETTEQFFQWRANEGELRSAFPPRTQSWAALQAECNAMAQAATVPAQLRSHPDFALFFLMAYPHRVRSDIVAFIDEIVRGPNRASK